MHYNNHIMKDQPEKLIFPCGAKGSPGFCPDVCQYGTFCKIKEKNKPQPRRPEEQEEEGRIEEIKEDKPEVEFYY